MRPPSTRAMHACVATATVEAGGGSAAVRAAPRVCFFAHYHHLGLAADHVLFYLDALRAAGFATVVLTTAALAPGEAERLSARCAQLVERPNTGLDFGGWQDALARYPDLSAELLLLANDSVYGPLGDLSAFIDRLTAAPADFYGAVESDSFGPHLQSWFVLLRPAAYRSAAFRAFMARPLDPALSKAAIVEGWELALTRALTGAGLTYRAAYRQSQVGPLRRAYGYNPTHMLWRELVERWGVPFVKVELLRFNPMRMRNLSAAPRLLAAGAPALAPLIADDLARRAPPPAPARTVRERLEAARDGRLRSYWPEYQGLLRRDARLAPGGLAARANAALFRVAAAAGSAAFLLVHGGLRLVDLAAGRRRGTQGRTQ